MIIDCHGHYTTSPREHEAWRATQIAALKDGASPPPRPVITDDEIRESIESGQLRIQRERGTDLTIFSPRAAGMGHHLAGADANAHWSQESNDLIHRVCQMFPRNFVGVCQLPQAPGVSPENCISELRRCVEDLGFIGCNLNPDPTGGYWTGPPLTDEWWFPVYEAMTDLDVPAMIHVSGSCNPNFHTTGAYYLAADTTVFMELLTSKLFERFPTLRFVIPHGGGAVPYHWGRYRGIAQDLGLGTLDELLLNNVYFDTCVYHAPGIRLLTEVIPAKNIIFASEMVGAVRGVDPETGHYYDDTRRYIDGLTAFGPAERDAVFQGNARTVYPRIAGALAARSQ